MFMAMVRNVDENREWYCGEVGALWMEFFHGIIDKEVYFDTREECEEWCRIRNEEEADCWE